MKVIDDILLYKLALTKLPDLKDVIVTGNFYCDRNNLTSLEGASKFVGDHFYCDRNNLTSLEGAPKYVGGNFNCSNNNLTSLEGAPKFVGGDFICANNKVEFTEEYVRSLVRVGGEVYVHLLDV